ncbi:hypothetical protein LP109_14665 (plasmid) [Moraxella bovis]|uniref:Uncharacterized protein n=1 Tax=Moraxella bovis TaxID=476 RepID=A0ABY6MBH2_MORBO|nr:hypothetical protein [Moraxella bovis]UYZ77098.1 hypothetical protein LP093_14090 [Moraxella bovis]UYZ79788.1 hypothetical protein LP115_14090 [Moraxella bovis]UYZ88282.1 hypothetical protein LP094_14175 [Moraxella bovis]UYZ91004.1 hypothetical protein LP114_14355 [Moraxella bovis]UYZ99225.1 hypothetical protein LP107_14055 [Moraxella bovis]
MKKRQTKAQRFRQLLPEIEKLQEEYLQEAVVEILNEQYGLDINLNTFKNYLHRYGGNKSEEISVNQNKIDTEIFDDKKNCKTDSSNQEEAKKNTSDIGESESDDNKDLSEYFSKLKKDIEKERENLSSNQSLFKKG